MTEPTVIRAAESTVSGAFYFSSRERMAWVDALRVLACFLVVMAHACDPFVGMFDTDRTGFLTGVISSSLTRASVPLFVMMTAVVLLPLRSGVSLGGFYRKRIGRIALPLIFWSLALPVVMWAYFRWGNPSTANAMIDMAAYTDSALLNKLYTWLFNFNFDTTPLWYLYMLIGLYLVIPIIDGWLRTATRRDVGTFLVIWAVSSLLPWFKMAAPLLGYVGNYGHMGVWGECDWNPFGMLYYVSGYIGYIVLAWYLTRWPLQWSRARMWAVMLPMFLVGYAATVIGFLIVQVYYPGDYAYLEIVFYMCGLNVIMMVIPVFTSMQRIGGNAKPVLTKMAAMTFGIYLCHYPFEYIAYDLLDIQGMWPAVRLVGGAVIAFACATFVTWLLSRWPVTRRLVA